MKTALQISLAHQLSMTPQLQQAIRLLQLSTLDLQQEMQKMLIENPLLDSPELNEEAAFDENQRSQSKIEIPIIPSATTYDHKNTINSPDESQSFENFLSKPEGLQDYLYWQLDLTPMSDMDRAIAQFMIDAINDEGFLTIPIAEIQDIFRQNEMILAADEINVVRHLLQRFDPIGCACYTLSETLLVQLSEYSQSFKEIIPIAKSLIQDHLPALAKHQYQTICQNLHIDETQLQAALKLIQSLNPKPGYRIGFETAAFTYPDVVVKKLQGSWTVFLTQDITSKLYVNQKNYQNFMNHVANHQESQYFKNRLKEANWFLKGLQTRQETLYYVSQFIVKYQEKFFEHGDIGLKPLTLSEVASALNLHESTISRITTNKYMATPRGFFELKYFFSSHLNTTKGDFYSSKALQALIKQLINQENPKTPLSDSKIVGLIAKQGIHVARRTVAKYREAMDIPSSAERKLRN